jgi:hypothetical protein
MYKRVNVNQLGSYLATRRKGAMRKKGKKK